MLLVLLTARNFSITGSFITAPTISFNGTGNVALAATISQNSIVLGTYTSGNYVQSILPTSNQISISGSATPGGQPQIGLTNSVNITNDLYVGNSIGIGTAVLRSAVDFADAQRDSDPTSSFMIPPKVSSTDRVGLTTVEGGVIYNTTVRRLELYLGNDRGWVGIATVA